MRLTTSWSSRKLKGGDHLGGDLRPHSEKHGLTGVDHRLVVVGNTDLRELPGEASGDFRVARR